MCRLLLVAPICAHTLNQRPFVVGAQETLDVRAEWEGDEVQADRLDTMLTLDGQVGVSLRPGDIVRVRRSSQIARLLRDPNDSFLRPFAPQNGVGQLRKAKG